MSETPNEVYGRLKEAAHLTGYGFERMTRELDWLLDEDRWRTVGPGFDDIEAFTESVDLSLINIEEKKKLAKKLGRLRATQKARAKALGVSQGTVSKWTTGRSYSEEYDHGAEVAADQREQPGEYSQGISASREEAERWHAGLRRDLALSDVHMTVALIGGVPRAELVRRIMPPSDWGNGLPRDVVDSVYEIIVNPRVDGVYAFPHGGHYRMVGLDMVTWEEWPDFDQELAASARRMLEAEFGAEIGGRS